MSDKICLNSETFDRLLSLALSNCQSGSQHTYPSQSSQPEFILVKEKYMYEDYASAKNFQGRIINKTGEKITLSFENPRNYNFSVDNSPIKDSNNKLTLDLESNKTLNIKSSFNRINFTISKKYYFFDKNVEAGQRIQNVQLSENETVYSIQKAI